jgi:hypothetical protein
MQSGAWNAELFKFSAFYILYKTFTHNTPTAAQKYGELSPVYSVLNVTTILPQDPYNKNVGASGHLEASSSSSSIPIALQRRVLGPLPKSSSISSQSPQIC